MVRRLLSVSRRAGAQGLRGVLRSLFACPLAWFRVLLGAGRQVRDSLNRGAGKSLGWARSLLMSGFSSLHQPHLLRKVRLPQTLAGRCECNSRIDAPISTRRRGFLTGTKSSLEGAEPPYLPAIQGLHPVALAPLPSPSLPPPSPLRPSPLPCWGPALRDSPGTHQASSGAAVSRDRSKPRDPEGMGNGAAEPCLVLPPDVALPDAHRIRHGSKPCRTNGRRNRCSRV